MTTSLTKKLALVSYNRNKLDAEKVATIANKLKRSELKQYIRALKRLYQQRTVFLETAFPLTKEEQKAWQDIFAEKQIIYSRNPNLLVGIKIINNDIIYQMNLQNNLDTISTQLSQHYDR